MGYSNKVGFASRLLLIFFICCFGVLQSNAQKYALLKKHSKFPVLYADSISVQRIKQGYFPIEMEKIDTFLANLNYISGLLSNVSRAKMASFELRNGTTILKVERVPFAYGDKYSVSGTTKSGEISAVTSFTNIKLSNKENKEEIDKMIQYLTNNQTMFGYYREITPKIYNVQVITD